MIRDRIHAREASAPGSLMLMGEHAVLHGRRALCAAVDKRIHVRVQPRSDQELHVKSSLGEYHGNIREARIQPPFSFALAALLASNLPHGMDVEIEADFASTLGFGSSAAVTVAVLAAVQAARGEPLDRPALFETALGVYRAVQGRASGADLAAAVFGGVVLYRADPVEIEPLVCSLPLSAHYAGYKTPTPDVIAKVESYRAEFPGLFSRIFEAMDATVEQATRAIRSGDLEKLGHLFRIHHGLQVALGTCDATLAALVHGLEPQPGVLGAKISGSGLGDCVIALGGTPAISGYEAIPVPLDTQGVKRDG